MTLNAILPHVLAVVNLSTIAALLSGYHFIRSGKLAVDSHWHVQCTGQQRVLIFHNFAPGTYERSQ